MLNRLAVRRVTRFQGAAAIQDTWHDAGAVGRKVYDDKDCSWQVRRQSFHQLSQRFHPTRRGTEDDNIVTRHLFISMQQMN
jgi:hypothetical protein